MNVEIIKTIKITDMKDSIITGFELEGNYYKLENNGHEIKKTISKREYYQNKRHPNTIDKWIQEKNIQVFRFNDLRKLSCYRKDNMQHYISKMIADKTLLQVGKDKFKVNLKEGK